MKVELDGCWIIGIWRKERMRDNVESVGSIDHRVWLCCGTLMGRRKGVRSTIDYCMERVLSDVGSR